MHIGTPKSLICHIVSSLLIPVLGTHVGNVKRVWPLTSPCQVWTVMMRLLPIGQSCSEETLTNFNQTNCDNCPPGEFETTNHGPFRLPALAMVRLQWEGMDWNSRSLFPQCPQSSDWLVLLRSRLSRVGSHGRRIPMQEVWAPHLHRNKKLRVQVREMLHVWWKWVPFFVFDVRWIMSRKWLPTITKYHWRNLLSQRPL